MPIKYDDFYNSFSLYHFQRWEWYRIWHYVTEIFKHRSLNIILYKRFYQPPSQLTPLQGGGNLNLKSIITKNIQSSTQQNVITGEVKTTGYLVKIPITVINTNTYNNLITILPQGLQPTASGSEYTNDLYIEPYTHLIQIRKVINHFFFQTIDLDLEIKNISNNVIYYTYKEEPKSSDIFDFINYFVEYTPVPPIKLGYVYNLDYLKNNGLQNVKFTKRSIYIRKPEYLGIEYEFMNPGDLLVDFNRVVLMVREFALLYSIFNLPYLVIRYNTIQNNNIVGLLEDKEKVEEIVDYIGMSEYDAKIKTIKDFYW